MAQLEIATYVIVSLLTLCIMVIAAGKFIGPESQIPPSKDAWAIGSGIALVEFICGGCVILLETRSLLSNAAALSANHAYLNDTNQLVIVIYLFLASFMLLGDLFLSPSKWQLLMLGLSTLICIIILTVILEFGSDDGLEDFLQLAVIAIISCIVIGLLIYGYGQHKLKEKHANWFKPLYLSSKKVIKIFRSPKSALVQLILVFIMFFLAWSDTPLF